MRIGLQARILLLATVAIVAIFAMDFATEAYVQVRNAQQRMGEQSRTLGAAPAAGAVAGGPAGVRQDP